MTIEEISAYIVGLREGLLLIDTRTSILARQEACDIISKRIAELEKMSLKQIGFVEAAEFDKESFDFIEAYRAGKLTKDK